MHPAPQPAGRRPRRPQPLSPRERLILRSLDDDLTLGQIAAGLYVSRNTVKSQVQSVYRKLGVTRRADAVAAAHALQLV
jgi:LuxR family transcriptional regulator, transcriptional regulator of spore coat protein